MTIVVGAVGLAVFVGIFFLVGGRQRASAPVTTTPTLFVVARSGFALSFTSGTHGNCPGFPVERVQPTASERYDIVVKPDGATQMVEAANTIFFPDLNGTTTNAGKLTVSGQNQTEKVDLTGSFVPAHHFDGTAVVTFFGPNGLSCSFTYVVRGSLGAPY